MTRNDHIGFSASVGSERCPHNNEIRKICFSCRDFWHACIGIRSIAKEFAAAVRAEKLRCLGRYFNCFGACRTFRIDETHDSFLSPIDGSCVAYSCAPHGKRISFGLKARRGKGVGGSFPSADGLSVSVAFRRNECYSYRSCRSSWNGTSCSLQSFVRRAGERAQRRHSFRCGHS